MKTALALVGGIILGAIGGRLYSPSTEPAPEPSPAAALPDLPEPYYTVLFENEVVRVVDHVLEPGQAEPEHTHPPMVAYFVEGATVLITEADGSSSEATLPSGAFVEQPEWWTHSLDNIGETPLHSILVEMKDPAGG